MNAESNPPAFLIADLRKAQANPDDLRAFFVTTSDPSIWWEPAATDEELVQRVAVGLFHQGGADLNAEELAEFIKAMESLCPNPTKDVDGEPVKSCGELIAAKLRFELGEYPAYANSCAIFDSAATLGLLRAEEVANARG